MSYAVGPRLLPVGENYESARESHPGYAMPVPSYQTYPLGQLAPAPPLPERFSLANVNVRQVMLVVAVVIVVAIVLYQMMKLAKNTKKVERNAVVSRLSTKELAQRLYDRLEAKGSRTSTTTMRSLERLSR